MTVLLSGGHKPTGGASSLVCRQFFFVGQSQRPRRARPNAGWFLTRLRSLNAEIALHYGFAVTRNIDDPERTDRQAEPAADTLLFVDKHWVISLMPMYRTCRTNRNTRRILAVPAVDGYRKTSRRFYRDPALRPRRLLRSIFQTL
jgi:hypothetical protein